MTAFFNGGRNMYRIETHMHTSQSSACASSTAEEMVNAYKNLGYNGVIITDHFLNGSTTVDRSQCWEKQIEDFCKGYEAAKLEGDKIGIDVFFGLEYTYAGTDLLTYGVDKHWLIEHPEIMDLPVPEYIKLIQSSGGMIIEAHPFREASYITTIRLYPKFVDGMEVRNTAPEHYTKVGDDLSRAVCEAYNLCMTSGSDSHNINRIGKGGMEFDEDIKDIFDYIRFVKQGRGKLL